MFSCLPLLKKENKKKEEDKHQGNAFQAVGLLKEKSNKIAKVTD